MSRGRWQHMGRQRASEPHQHAEQQPSDCGSLLQQDEPATRAAESHIGAALADGAGVLRAHPALGGLHLCVHQAQAVGVVGCRGG